MNIRAFTTSAVPMTTASGAPSWNNPVATICEAPAFTSSDMPTTSRPPKPASITDAPATSPNGTMPSRMGATSFAPAFTLCDFEKPLSPPRRHGTQMVARPT